MWFTKCERIRCTVIVNFHSSIWIRAQHIQFTFWNFSSLVFCIDCFQIQSIPVVWIGTKLLHFPNINRTLGLRTYIYHIIYNLHLHNSKHTVSCVPKPAFYSHLLLLQQQNCHCNMFSLKRGITKPSLPKVLKHKERALIVKSSLSITADVSLKVEWHFRDSCGVNDVFWKGQRIMQTARVLMGQ